VSSTAGVSLGAEADMLRLSEEDFIERDLMFVLWIDLLPEYEGEVRGRWRNCGGSVEEVGMSGFEGVPLESRYK
jgi:hypothetical protein